MSARKLQPTGNRILVQPLKASTATRGGILLADNWQTPSGRGIIVAVGGQVRVEELKPGATVLYNWIDGIEVEHQGENCRLLQVGEVLGVEP